MSSFLDRYEALIGRLPGDSRLRADAADAFRASGIPGEQRRRAEAWKYTSLRPVAETAFRAAGPVHEAETILRRLPLLDAPCAVFVDGALRDDLTAEPGLAGCSSRFALTPDFGTLTRPDQEPMVALNTMLAEDGLVLEVGAGDDFGTLQIVHIAASNGDFHPRHIIRLRENARLALIEHAAGDGIYLTNTVTEVHLAAGAHLTHIRIQQDASTAFHVSTVYADVGPGATYDSFTLSLGGRLSRTEAHVGLNGPKAMAHLNGANLLTGAQHADFTSVVRHEAPNCQSRQTVKNVLAGRARGVFQGRIEVARDAQKTDGYQMNQALLLSPEAEIDSKPELEIFADDVKCSHGATVGELDAEQLFYLRSRGVPEAEARAILVHAFLSELLDTIADDTIRDHLERIVETRWESLIA
ncbi:MAG TPA: Fe-S cluster assembly protein SufD [Rhodopila sp.]|uniref:Fe-S cluster assembly protein SufD n=1 Tax=Rhodopila sp. TaxID=2480087 RepID=UPI002CFC8E75|nr:Fe-S cluster assembly protein SufD [Rhodopila sp.]HVY18058.1 Fe-S cluster assembly protein SufD [Rhodopila sp.]